MPEGSERREWSDISEIRNMKQIRYNVKNLNMLRTLLMLSNLVTAALYAQPLDGNALFSVLNQPMVSEKVKNLAARYNLTEKSFGPSLGSTTYWINLYSDPVRTILLQQGTSSEKKEGFPDALPLGLRFGMNRSEIESGLGNTSFFYNSQGSGSTYFFVEKNVMLTCRYAAEANLIALSIEAKDYADLFDTWVKMGHTPQLKPADYVYFSQSNATLGKAAATPLQPVASAPENVSSFCGALGEAVRRVSEKAQDTIKGEKVKESASGTVIHQYWASTVVLPGAVSSRVEEGTNTATGNKLYCQYKAVLIGNTTHDHPVLLQKASEWKTKLLACLSAGYTDRSEANRAYLIWSNTSKADIVSLRHDASGTMLEMYQRPVEKGSTSMELVLIIKKQFAFQ